MSSYLTFIYQGYLISLIKFTCMQFSRYDTDWIFISHIRRKVLFSSYITGKTSFKEVRFISFNERLKKLNSICALRLDLINLFIVWRPPALPHRLQCSTIGRLRLNRRVRDGNGCFPQAHRHQKGYLVILDNSTVKHIWFSTSSFP